MSSKESFKPPRSLLPRPRRPGWWNRLYQWVLHWAETPYALPALFAVSFAEASFFPIPPDILLVAMVLARPDQWLRYGTVCTIASVLGALFGYLVGWGLWGLVHPYFFDYIISEQAFGSVVQRYDDAALITVFTAALSPIPFKIVTLAGGVAQISILSLILGSILGRGGRFLVIAVLLHRFGPPMKEYIERYFDLLALLAILVLAGTILLTRYVL